MHRYRRLWERWDGAVAAGRRPHEFLQEVSDESLIELLAGATEQRQYERDLIATELKNRMVRLHKAMKRATDEVVATVNLLTDAVLDAEDIVHGVETAAEAHRQGIPEANEDLLAEAAHEASATIENVALRTDHAGEKSKELEAATRELRANRRWGDEGLDDT